jgi:hypothetical protein
MRSIPWRKPSPALVISIVALFVALGGSAYAATKIGTKDIKANAITTGKIKKNAITTSKIKKEAVTGAKINEASLGTVPSATNAVNATNATNFSRYFTIGIVKATGGQTVALYSSGPFAFYGHCKDLGGGSYEAFTSVTTSQPNSSMGSEEDSYYEADFQPGIDAQINYAVSGSTPESNIDYPSYYGGFETDSADGKTMVSGELFSGVIYFGSPCAFWGHGLNNAL